MECCTRLRRLICTAFFVALGSTASLAQQDCASLVSQLQDKETRDFDDAVRFGSSILSAETCPAETRRGVARRLALLHVRQANRTGTAAAAQLQLLDSGLRFARPWQLMAMIGDLHLQGVGGKPDLRRASEAYEAALDDIKDTRSVPSPPPKPQIERLIGLAQQVRLAANEFIPGTGLSTRNVRGVSVDAVPVPIKFVRGSDAMTLDGQKYAEETEKQLKALGQPAIILLGHTDPDGSDDYNLKLSVRRAQAMKKFLVENGYNASSIQVEGRGRREPLRVIDEQQFNKDQLFEMQRRVEVRFP